MWLCLNCGCSGHHVDNVSELKTWALPVGFRHGVVVLPSLTAETRAVSEMQEVMLSSPARWKPELLAKQLLCGTDDEEDDWLPGCSVLSNRIISSWVGDVLTSSLLLVELGDSSKNAGGVDPTGLQEGSSTSPMVVSASEGSSCGQVLNWYCNSLV